MRSFRSGFRTKLGVTLIEVLVAMSVFSLLMGAVFAIFAYGTRAWRFGDLRSDMISSIQVLLVRLESELEGSHRDSVSESDAGTGIAFAVPIDDEGEVVYDLSPVQLQWKRFLVYGFDLGSLEVLRTSVPIVEGTPASEGRQTFEVATGQSQEAALVDGRTVARGISEFTVTYQPESGLVEVLIRADKPPEAGQQAIEPVSIRTFIWVRN